MTTTEAKVRYLATRFSAGWRSADPTTLHGESEQVETVGICQAI